MRTMLGFRVESPPLIEDPNSRRIMVEYDDGSEIEFVAHGPEGSLFLRNLVEVPNRLLPLRYVLDKPVEVDERGDPIREPARKLFEGLGGAQAAAAAEASQEEEEEEPPPADPDEARRIAGAHQAELARLQQQIADLEAAETRVAQAQERLAELEEAGAPDQEVAAAREALLEAEEALKEANPDYDPEEDE